LDLIKEVCVKAYTQFLEPYEAVDIARIVASFGVTPDFIEAEMRRLISSRKLNSKIGRLTGTIHTTPLVIRAAQMREALRRAELLVTQFTSFTPHLWVPRKHDHAITQNEKRCDT
jgi:26S proteasome regulatory subunit N7